MKIGYDFNGWDCFDFWFILFRKPVIYCHIHTGRGIKPWFRIRVLELFGWQVPYGHER